MKVEVKKIDATKRELKFEIPKDRVAQKLEQIFEDITKHAKIRGYRPGKAPRHLVEQQYGKLAQEEMVKDIIPETYHEALKNENINPIDLPEIEDVLYKDGVVKYTAKLDIYPEIEIKDYKGLKVTRRSSQITDEELNKVLDIFKKGQGQDKEAVLDDAWAHGLGYPNLEDFKNSLKRQMEMDKDRQNRTDIESQVIEQLLKNAKLSIPQSAIDKQVHHRIHELEHRYQEQGLKKEDIDKKIEGMRKDLEKISERDVKVFFILNKIAELENIQVDKGENVVMKVLEFLLKEAQWSSDDPSSK